MATRKKNLSLERNRLQGLKEPGGYLDSLKDQSQGQISPDRKKDRHKGSVTLSIRVSDELAAWVQQQAKAEGISANAWMARLLENIKSGKPPA